jgi:CheY-like chemotaxis protein
MLRISNHAKDKQKALDAGFTTHLTKPIGIKEITEAFKEFLPVAI